MSSVQGSIRRSPRGFLAVGAAWLALLTVMVLAYLPGLAGPFLLDDFDAIFPLAANLEAGTGWLDVLRQAPSHIQARWVSNFSFLLSQALSGAGMPPAPFAYKLGNLIVHGVTGLMVYVLAMQLFHRFGRPTGPARLGAAIAMGLFLLHPLLLSTVLYPVQRMAQLATLFALLSVASYILWRQELDRWSSAAHWSRIGATAALVALAYFSKENGALALLLIGVTELVVFRWPAPGTNARHRLEQGFGVLCAAPLVLGMVWMVTRMPSIAASYAGREFTLWERLLTELHVVASYLGNIFWPAISSMGLFRDDFPITRTLDIGTLLLAALFLAAALAAVAFRRRWPAPSFAVLWFFAAHAMESTIIPLELVFEHRNYLALPGICLALGWALASLPWRGALALAVPLLLSLSWLTHERATSWSGYGMWLKAEAANHPGSRRASSDLVAHLARRGDFQEASALVARLKQRFPEEAQPAVVALWLHCGDSGILSRELDAGDIRQLRQAVVSKDTFHIFNGLMDAAGKPHCPGLQLHSLAQAARYIVRNPSLDRDPRAVAGWNRILASILARLGNWQEVRDALERATAAQPNHPPDWLLLMKAHVMAGDLEGYLKARGTLLQFLGGRLGSLSAPFEAIEEAAGQRFEFGGPDPGEGASSPQEPGAPDDGRP